MPTGSFSLSKQGDTWFAEGVMESGRQVRFECGKGSRDNAEGIASMKWEKKLQASDLSKRRWAKVAAAKAGAGTPPPSSAPPPPTAAAAPSSSERSAQIRGKLLSLGDSKPIDDDQGDEDDDDADDDGAEGEYIPPDGERDEDDDEEGEDDEEAGEFLAEMLGNGATAVVSGGVTKFLRHRTPPKRPGEPHEKFVDYTRQGFTHRARKLVGKNAKLGPNGKLFVGLAGMIGMMLWNAEEIEAEERRADAPRAAAPSPPPPRPAAPPAAPPPPAAAAAPPAHANGTAPKPGPPSHLALVRPPSAEDGETPDDPLGSFS